ncbi:MAG TPA: DUF397 domain-containing protein, partial [Micromonosporaceae bacterium]|nr:DUF397 domain-containing protein [Micromonosporaceae bacterium]
MSTVPAPVDWRHGRRGDTGNRVEVTRVGGLVFMRESRRPEAVLMFSAADWTAFVAGVR